MDSVKQSAALCLLRLNRTSPDLVPMGEWTSRVVHLLNDQHLVRACCQGVGALGLDVPRGMWGFSLRRGDTVCCLQLKPSPPYEHWQISVRGLCNIP